MFNSIMLRERLKAANHDPLRRDRLNPHRDVFRDAASGVGPNEMVLESAWRVECRDQDRSVSEIVEQDFSEFLRLMDVGVRPDAEHTVIFRTAADLGPRDCRYECRPDGITIEGGGIAGLWAGLTWLEWEMRVRHGAILPLGRFERRALWTEQISQGPWGANFSVPDFSPEFLDDNGFRLYAHYGITSMMIYGDMLCYVKSAILPELNCPDYERNIAMLRDAARRAGRYGVGFSYLVVGPKLRGNHPVFANHPEARGTSLHDSDIYCLCSSDPRVLAFYEETFSNLLREVPELRGLILIVGGESFYHCRMWVNAKQPCPVCYAREPEEMLANLIGRVQTAVRNARPDAYVAVWQYNTTPCMQDRGLKLIHQLPDKTVVMHQIDKGAVMQKDGYRKNIWDYSIDFNGIADLTRRYAEAARQSGHPFFVKTETGIGLEVIQFPYVPAMQRLADKWLQVRSLSPAGVHQAWLFFGMFGSRAEALGLWAAYRPDMSRDAFLEALARRDFGTAAVAGAVQAWEAMSKAMGHLPGIHYYYMGPGFMGPAHPLVPVAGARIPDVFYANLYYLTEGDESFSTKQMDDSSRICLVMDRLDRRIYGGISLDDAKADVWDVIEREYATATDESRRAGECLKTALEATAHPTARRNLGEEMLLTELVYRTMRACRNTIAYLRNRDVWEQTGEKGAHQAMQHIAADERENALAAIPIYRKAPWLDLALRLDGVYAPCEAMIREKIRWIDEWMVSTFGE